MKGTEWKSARTIVSQTFSPKKLKTVSIKLIITKLIILYMEANYKFLQSYVYSL